MEQSFITHYNGETPYMVKINGLHVNVYECDYEEVNDDLEPIAGKLIAEFFAQRIFIGKTECESSDDSFDEDIEHDGNSILLLLSSEGNVFKYAFIGNDLYTFTTNNKILYYYSPIENNDVPYPWAYCENGDHVLFIENVVLKHSAELEEHMTDPFETPYVYYYDNCTIIPENSENEQFYIGTKQCALMHCTGLPRCVEDMALVKNGCRHQLNKNDFMDLLSTFGNQHGFYRLSNMNIIHQPKYY